MPVTAEPRGLTWINNVNANVFGSLVSQVCWLVGSLVLTLADYQLLREDTELERQAGIFLAGILVTAWTGKTVAGVVDSNNKRKANPAYAAVLEAEHRGKVTGAAAALALKVEAADVAAQRRSTKEYEAQQPVVAVEHADRVEATATVAPAPPVKPKTEPNAYTDDERGD